MVNSKEKFNRGEPVMSTYQGRPVIVGHFNDERKSFFKAVKPGDLLKVCQAYGIDAEAIQELKGRGCREIVLQVKGGLKYKIGFQDFLNTARLIDWRAKGSNKFGARYYASLRFWQVVQTIQARQNSPKQESLFLAAGR